MSSQVYLDAMVREAPRLLSLLDRNPLSKTYGCFDRQFWHYKAIDFPCARMQEAALTLALLYRIGHEKNPYHGSGLVCEYVNAALDYWTGIQDGNGSFSEWYPHENSFVATVFTSYAASEALLLMGDEARKKSKVLHSLTKAAEWFMERDENRAVNQETGAIAALYNLFLLTGDEKYKRAASEKMEFIKANQHPEGWFPEYGGADMGYLSLAIDYLAKYYAKSGDKEALKVLENSVGYIGYFIHPDDTFGGEYTSRNTSYLIPDGFEKLAQAIPDAGLIAAAIRKSIENGSGAWPLSLDDRYLAYIGYTYLQAYLDSGELENNKGSLPRDRDLVKDFKGSGFWIYSNSDLYIVMNYRKGGASKIFFKSRGMSITDSGVLAESLDGARMTSSWLTENTDAVINQKGAKVKGTLHMMPQSYLTPVKSVMLRAFQMTAGKNSFIGHTVKNRLRDRLITKTGETSIKYSREIALAADGLTITDTIHDAKELKDILIGGTVSYVYTPSSRYFQRSDLNSAPLVISHKEISEHARSGALTVSRTYDLKGKIIRREIGR